MIYCTSTVLLCKPLILMKRVKGIEASTDISQSAETKCVTCGCKSAYTQIRAQIEKPFDPELRRIIAAWPVLSAPLRAAVLALVDTVALTEAAK
jgi:hypothetical protein